MEIMKDLKSGAMGKSEAAYIVVHDNRSVPEPSVTDSLTAIAGALRSGVAAGVNAVVDAVGGGGKKDRYFRVQYNPNELKINSVAAVLRKLDATGSERANAATPAGGHMDLTVNLFFDKMNPLTSFLLDKNVLPTNTGVIRNYIAARKSNQSDQSNQSGQPAPQDLGGVQPEVEGFIAALRNNRTRRVTFYWADFSFAGILNDLTAEYIMFDADGTPVRAKVTLRLRQNPGDPGRDSWLENYDTTFAGDQSSLVRPEQRFSSTLNPKF
ncbi:MAG: hypothetical protein LBH21_08595 [Gracilibacteraceae bacterium]|jgi:hypothetical protein|nr:hypothetical protein [Gracilibacteraceae bacterium]